MQQADPTFLPDPTPVAATRAPTRRRWLVPVLFLMILLAGGYLRFVGLNWDDFTHLHPDERFLTDVAQGLGYRLNPSDSSGDEISPQQQIELCLSRYPDSGGAGPYFDALCSTWNPHNANSGHGMYVYGTLPLFAARLAAEGVVSVTSALKPGDSAGNPYDGSYWRTYDGIHLVWRFLSALAEMSIVVLCFVMGRKLYNNWVGLLAMLLYSAATF